MISYSYTLILFSACLATTKYGSTTSDAYPLKTQSKIHLIAVQATKWIWGMLPRNH